MNYGELIQAYFERSVALQWYWTIYVLVIGGILGFSTIRQRREFVTAVLITSLFMCFAFKNEGAIEATADEREAIRVAFKDYPATGANAAEIELFRDKVEPKLTAYDIAGARHFHFVCDLLTIAYVWVRERRRQTADPK
jgi:hypothetical protein